MLRTLAIQAQDAWDRLSRKVGHCHYCRGDRRVLSYGSGRFADLIRCPYCRDGEKVATSIYPTVTEAPDVAA